MKRKLFAILLALIMTAAALPSLRAAAETDGPTRDESVTYYIGTFEALKAFAARVNAGETTLNAMLTADIDASGSDWTPIGNSENPYSGTFNGCGHIITGLHCDVVSSYGGLFGYIGRNGAVYKVGLENVNLRGTMYAGGMAGYNYGTIWYCYVRGTIIATGGSAANPSHAGGIVGMNGGSLYNVCFFSGTISAYKCGGHIGLQSLYNGTFPIDSYYNTASAYRFAGEGGDQSNPTMGGLTSNQMKGENAFQNMNLVSDFWYATDLYPKLVQTSVATEHTVTVENGTGGGTYLSGDSVTVTANEAPEGKKFRAWEGVDGLLLIDGGADTETVTFAMPDEDITITATWEWRLEDGYYLIGTNGWTADDIDLAQQFTVNPENANEYMLETTLAAGDTIKVVHVTSGAIDAWYPDPGDNYTVTADYAGSVTIYFKTTYDNAWSAFGGHIWIVKKAPTFATQSLILSGQIGLSFNMDLPDIEGVNWTESWMTFAIPHGTCTERANYMDTRAKASGNRGFVCYVNAIQMAEPITATFHWTEGEEEKTIEKTYAIKDYFLAYDGKKDTFSEPVQKLIESTADYGHYTQAYLADVKGWTLGENGDYYEMDKFYTTSYNYNDTQTGLNGYGFTCENNGADIKGLSFATVLDSATAIRLLITPTSGYTGTFTATVNNDKEVKVSKSGSRYIVEIPDLAAHELSKTYTITITTEGGTATITVSALSYVKLLFNAYETTPVRNAASAILGYASAAYIFQYAD